MLYSADQKGEHRMHPDVVRHQRPERGALSKGSDPDTKRAEALRRLLAEVDHYPHCPQCGRAMLAESAVQFHCPNNHATTTLKVPEKAAGLRRLLRVLTFRAHDRRRA
jgi:hypothetical protein